MNVYTRTRLNLQRDTIGMPMLERGVPPHQLIMTLLQHTTIFEHNKHYIITIKDEHK